MAYEVENWSQSTVNLLKNSRVSIDTKSREDAILCVSDIGACDTLLSSNNAFCEHHMHIKSTDGTSIQLK